MSKRYSDFTELVGRLITGIQISEDRSYLVFETPDGPLAFEGEGACCSHTYFAEVLQVAELLGKTVTAIEDMDADEMRQVPDKEYEVIQTYGHKIRTADGFAMIVYRNSSNGYYSGWVNWVTHVPDGTKMQRITSDFRDDD